MAELSPAAQAVLDAADDAIKEWPPVWEGAIAAALRAVADQVVPESEETPWGSTVQAAEPLLHVRHELLAIAAELEGADQATSSTH